MSKHHPLYPPFQLQPLDQSAMSIKGSPPTSYSGMKETNIIKMLFDVCITK